MFLCDVRCLQRQLAGESRNNKWNGTQTSLCIRVNFELDNKPLFLQKVDAEGENADAEITPSDKCENIIGVSEEENKKVEGVAEEKLDSSVPSPKRLRSSAQELKKKAQTDRKVKTDAEVKRNRKKTEKD